MTGPSKNPVLRARSFVPAWVPVAYASGLIVFIRIAGRARTREQAYLAALFVALGFVLVFLAAAARRAELGAEGIRLRWLFWRRQFSYAEIRRAEPKGQTSVSLTTMDGKTIALSVGYLDEASARDVLERFWTALSAGAALGARGAEREMLARSRRETREWRRALRELGAPASYRSATFSHDRLLTIAENPGIDAEIRVAAIVALTATEIDGWARDRLRAAGSVTVDPGLRDLLERIGAAGAVLDEDACDAALDAMRGP